MQDVTSWRIEARRWDDPAGAMLRARQREELDARYGTDDHEPGRPPSADDIAVFLVAVAVDSRVADDSDSDGHIAGAGDTVVGCGALRQTDPGSAEIKRMYVVPHLRGTGVATDLLRALESAATDRGWTTLRLETGTAQPEAQRFYHREGYHEIPLFGSYVGSEQSVCYERRLR